MLIGINPLLGPELLGGLRAMGHGDEIALVDGNYPALEHARRLVRMDGHSLITVLDAILSVLPLDHPLKESVFIPKMDAGVDRPAVHGEIDDAIARVNPDIPVTALPHADFYQRVRNCHMLVATGERRFYGNVILRKGVIAPD